MGSKYECFKNKFKEIDKFLYLNNAFVFLGPTEDKEKINVMNLEKDGDKFFIYVINNELNEILQYNKIEFLIKYFLSLYELPKYIYTNVRLNIKQQVFISRVVGIYIHYLDEKTKLYFILSKYFKFKQMINNYSRDLLLEQYLTIKHNDYLSSISKKSKIGVDYLLLVELKDLIDLYEQELNIVLDLNETIFNDESLLKYLDNFFSRYVVITYDEKIVQNYIKGYYKSDLTSEDETFSFVKNLIYVFSLVQNIDFSIETVYNLKQKQNTFWNLIGKTKKIKYLRFEKKFDLMMSNQNNYLNFIFMLEMLAPFSYRSSRKKIVDYISIIELLLTHLPKNEKDTISKQFIEKVYEIDNGFSNKELYHLYSYRSKVIHGEYRQMMKEIRILSKFDSYKLNIMEKNDLKLLALEEIIETKVSKRILKLIKKIIIIYIKNPEYINNLKKKEII